MTNLHNEISPVLGKSDSPNTSEALGLLPHKYSTYTLKILFSYAPAILSPLYLHSDAYWATGLEWLPWFILLA